MNKIFKKGLLILISIIVIFILLFMTSEWWCPSMWGSHCLGNNLYAMDWDGGVQIIVYNDRPSGRTVYSGAYIIPSSDNIYQVQIEDIKFNKEWIIVQANHNNEHKKCYFLIHKNFSIKGLDWQKDNCDSIIRSHIKVYYDLPVFNGELKEKKIDLKFPSILSNTSIIK